MPPDQVSGQIAVGPRNHVDLFVEQKGERDGEPFITLTAGHSSLDQALAEELVKNPAKSKEIVGPEALQNKIGKAGGLKGVTTTILDIAAAEMAKNPGYTPQEDKTPKKDGEIMIHYAACLECDPVFGAECEEQAVEKDLNKCVDKVQAMTKSLWCEHTLQALSALLLNKNMSDEKIQSLIDAAEGIAREKTDTGINTRHLFIALGRAVA